MNALGGLRALALVLLAALSLFIVFSPAAQRLRVAVFDTYQRVFPLDTGERPVTIVLIEENSIARVGPWPWPRTRMAELIEAIARYQPLAIGLDLVFPEPDRFSPAALAAQLPGLPAEVTTALARMPSNDERFAAALRGRDVVLGISAEGQGDARFRAPPRAPVVKASARVPELLRKHAGHIGNDATLDAAAAGRGLLNSGPPDQVVRIVPLAALVQGVVVPSLGVETLRLALGERLSLAHEGDGLMSLSLGRWRSRLQDDGHAWLRFRAHSNERTLPAAGVMAGDVNPELIRDRIVLVGVSGLGLLDYKTTPLGEFVPGVHIHAQVVENLYTNVWLVRPDYAAQLEAAVLLACGLVLVVLVPRLSALKGINVALGLVVLVTAAGVAAFLQAGYLFDPAWPAIGIAAVFGSVVVGTLSESDRQRRELREQAAHMAGEVDAARRIQMGLLPDPHELFAHDRRFQLATLLEPARTVGGDFYDCFMVDARHLFVVVADVSGKGLPAALFMAAAKSHLKSAAMRERDVGEALTRAQDEIARENPEQLFVTAFAAMLDVHTGLLQYANAGHEPPFLRRAARPLERLERPDGPPLCVLEDFDYPTRTVQLEPADLLCVVTDGATEATNPSREFFGVERLVKSLESVGERATPADVVRRLRDDVNRFAAGSEPADDLTLVAIQWHGVGGLAEAARWAARGAAT